MIYKEIFSNKYLRHLICFIPFALIFSIFIADLLCSICVLIYLKKIINEKIKIFNNYFVKLLLLFWAYLLIRGAFTLDIVIFSKIFFYFRFILLGSLICSLVYDKKFLILLKNYILVSLIVVAFTAYLELFFQINYFSSIVIPGRISGIFGDELIIGSYLARILPIFIAINFFLLNKNLSSLVVFVIVFPVILGSGERTAMILFFILVFLTFIYLLYVQKNNIKIFFYISFSIIIFSFLFWQYVSTTHTKNRVLSIASIENIKLSYNNYKPTYESAYKVFNNNKIFGVGPRNFRNVCNDKENFVKNGCTTHPHNIVLQLLSETGLVGISFYFLIIFSLIVKFVKTPNSNNLIITQKYLFILIMVNLFPFVPSGNFFNNFMNLLYYIPIGLSLGLFEKKN